MSNCGSFSANFFIFYGAKQILVETENYELHQTELENKKSYIKKNYQQNQKPS